MNNNNKTLHIEHCFPWRSSNLAGSSGSPYPSLICSPESNPVADSTPPPLWIDLDPLGVAPPPSLGRRIEVPRLSSRIPSHPGFAPLLVLQQQHPPSRDGRMTRSQSCGSGPGEVDSSILPSPLLSSAPRKQLLAASEWRVP